MSLDGRAALVTGAAQGMGREHCLRLAAQGAVVGAVDIDERSLVETVDAVRAQGGEALGLAADVSDRDAVDGAVARFADAHGRLDIVVSNAGTIHAETGLADT